MTFDEIDNHATSGVAEDVARMLTEGWRPYLVARAMKISPITVGYIAIHPDYGVPNEHRCALNRVVEGKRWDELSRFRREQKSARRIIAAIRKVAENA